MKILILTIALALIPSLATAQKGQTDSLCNTADDASEVAVISSCTRLLDGGQLDLAERAAVYHSRGTAHWRNWDYDAAIADESEVIGIDPGFAEAYMRRGVAFFGKGEFDRAISDSTRAIEIDPLNVRAYTNRSAARRSNGDRRGAMADVEKAIEIDPKFATAYILRYELFTASSAPRLAAADLETVMQMEPQGGFLGYRMRAYAYERKG